MTKQSSLQYLMQTLEQLKDACKWLDRSYQQCKSFDLNVKFTPEQYDALENLSSRFARVADLLINKTFRALDVAELMEPGSIIDTVNRAVKRGLVDQAQTARTIKDIRNEIVHEYVVEDLQTLLSDVNTYAPVLLHIADQVFAYVNGKVTSSL